MRRNGLDSTKKERKTPVKKNDIILAGIFLMIALLGCFILYRRSEPGKYIQVSVDGIVTGTYFLEEDRTIPIEGSGGNNTLVIEDGRAKMKEADCPDKICVSHMPVEKKGESIVCLPHKVVAEVIGEDREEKDPDAVDIIAR